MADMRKWRQERCSGCGGHGIVSGYTLGGTDFVGAEECDDCNGGGVIYIHRRTGTIAEYPGGRLLGRLSKKEKSHV